MSFIGQATSHGA
ncbi:unnamed protein product, partial [Rotaria sp. Silwood1]